MAIIVDSRKQNGGAMKISKIVEKLDNPLWSVHCVEKMQARDISREEVKECILNGEIIEEYPDSFPFPNCLIYGKLNNKTLHVVVGLTDVGITIITAYEPNNLIFEDDLKTRRKK